jgi:ribose transport system ATP-binding protein
MEEAPRVLILDEPTRGVDVGAREEMFRIIIALAGSGMAVILISSDLNEVVGLSHRVLLYRDGAIDGEVLPGATSLEAIMARLTGAGGRGS